MDVGSSNTKDRGDETEAKILSTLLAAGYSVSIPFGDNDKYDLVVDAGTDLHRIQCKTAWQNNAETNSIQYALADHERWCVPRADVAGRDRRVRRPVPRHRDALLYHEQT